MYVNQKRYLVLEHRIHSDTDKDRWEVLKTNRATLHFMLQSA